MLNRSFHDNFKFQEEEVGFTSSCLPHSGMVWGEVKIDSVKRPLDFVVVASSDF